MDTPPDQKRNISLKDEIIPSPSTPGIPSSLNQRKLRRLPHIFSSVLELPFNSEVRVAVEENEKCFRFVVNSEEALALQEARVEIEEIVPGVIKLAIRKRISKDAAELDVWRFRLPSSTLPELSTAVYSHGEFVVTVPKDVVVREADFYDEDYEIRSLKKSTLRAEVPCAKKNKRLSLFPKVPCAKKGRKVHSLDI